MCASTDPLKKLGIVFLKEAAKREDSGDVDGAERSRRVALSIYEVLLDDNRSGDGESGDASVAGLERLVTDLRQQIGTAVQ